MAFPNENKTLTGKDGADVTLINAKKKSTYTSNEWTFRDNFGYWDITEDTTFPFYNPELYYSYLFTSDNQTLTGKDGADVSLLNAKKEVTYTSNGWDFTNIWHIYENISFPYLLLYVSEPPTPSVSLIKVYANTEWIDAPIKMYNGSTWVDISLKVYSGSSWN